MSIKKTYIFALLLFLLLSINSAYSDNAKSYGARNYSFQFAIGRDFRLTSFGGAMISVSRNLSSNSALRLGLTVVNLNAERDQKRYYPDNFETTQIRERDDVRFDLDLKYIHASNTNRPVAFYIGAGPRISYDYDFNRDRNESSRYIRRNAYMLGLGTCWGAEWRMSKNLSLTAEYTASLMWRYYEESRDYSLRGHFIARRLSFRSEGVLFGLSVYL